MNEIKSNPKFISPTIPSEAHEQIKRIDEQIDRLIEIKGTMLKMMYHVPTLCWPKEKK